MTSKWVGAWTTGAQAAYPAGYEVGQPGIPRPLRPNATGPLLTFAFPQNVAKGQTLRMIIHPRIGGRVWRLRLTNVFMTSAVTFGDVKLALQASGATIAGVRRDARAGVQPDADVSGRRSVTVAAGSDVLSDRVPFKLRTRLEANLAVSVYVRGMTGPMTLPVKRLKWTMSRRAGRDRCSLANPAFSGGRLDPRLTAAPDEDTAGASNDADRARPTWTTAILKLASEGRIGNSRFSALGGGSCPLTTNGGLVHKRVESSAELVQELTKLDSELIAGKADRLNLDCSLSVGAYGDTRLIGWCRIEAASITRESSGTPSPPVRKSFQIRPNSLPCTWARSRRARGR